MSISNIEFEEIENSIFPGEPEVFLRRNVLYVPNFEGGSDNSFGLYDETGRQLLSNAHFHKVPSILKTQPILTNLMASKLRPRIKTAIYGGAIGNHYGHFITECFNVLWYYILYGKKSDKILFHSNLDVEEIYKKTWMSEFLSYAGVEKEQIIISKCPIVVESLVVPGQAFSEDGFAYEVYASACRKVGNIAIRNASPLPDGPFYFSRNNIERGTLKIINEYSLMDALSKFGVNIIYPEECSVATQIAALHRPSIGLIGSAFHSSIFVDKPRAVILCPTKSIPRSFQLMDAVHSASIKYVKESQIVQGKNSPNFGITFILSDPYMVAEELFSILSSKNINEIDSKNFIIKNKNLNINILYAENGEAIVLHCPTERMYSRRPLKNDINILAITLGEYVFLVAQHNDAPMLMVVKENKASPVLVYKRGSFNGELALQDLRTKAWLKAPPSQVGLCLHGDGQEVKKWERFVLKPNDFSEYSGRLAEIIKGLQDLAESGDIYDVSLRYPILRDAIKDLDFSLRN
ncbi:glycosyltransferase family 61 protein [Gluconobacter cerinus]|uniref:glycosyltransferase family 61 protein n=1 Tax=Gluconobacter cerinus TaxID=38307 RepID=UPI003AB7CF49